MAKVNIRKFVNVPDTYKFEHHSLVVSKDKDFHHLVSKLTQKALLSTDSIFEEELKEYSFAFKGRTDPAIGEGIEFITVYGGLETELFIPKRGGDEVKMKLPHQGREFSEVIGDVMRFRTITRRPDLLSASTVFVKPSQLFEFYRMKRRVLKEGNAKWMWLILTTVFATNPLDLYIKDGTAADLIGSSPDENTNKISKNLPSLKDQLHNKAKGEWLTREELDKATAEVDKGDDDMSKSDLKEQAYMLESIKACSKSMIEKEKKITNIYVYDAFEWLPTVVAENPNRYFPGTGKTVKKADLSKYFQRNKDVSSFYTVCGLVRLMSRILSQMQRRSYMNMPYYTGNKKLNDNEEVFSEKYKDDIFALADWQACPKEKLIVMMNPLTHDFIRSFIGYWNSDNPSYSPNIASLLSDINIIGVPTMAPNIIKLGSSDRYNVYKLYEKVVDDKLGQEDVETDTHHVGWLTGIRQHVPFAIIQINKVNFDPYVNDIIDGSLERKEGGS